MKKNSCTYEYLASSEFAQILFCRDCQSIHLQLQHLTLRFNAKTFFGVVDTLASASSTLKAMSSIPKKATQLTIVK